MNRTTYLVCAIIVLYVSLNFGQCEDKISGLSSASKKNSTGSSRYCGNSLVRAMRLICDGTYADPYLKRSLETSVPSFRRNRRHKIWKLKYKIKDSDLVTLSELDSQYQTLFGSEVHVNTHLPNAGFFSTSIKDGRMVDDLSNDIKNRRKRDLVRNKRGIYEECCAKPCTVTYLKRYCLNAML